MSQGFRFVLQREAHPANHQNYNEFRHDPQFVLCRIPSTALALIPNTRISVNGNWPMRISVTLTTGIAVVGPAFAQLPVEITVDRHLLRAERQLAGQGNSILSERS